MYCPAINEDWYHLIIFGGVSFSNGFAVQNGSQVSISGSGARPMTMITDNDQALAAPSSLGADGASFTVTRTTAAASTPTVAKTGRWSRTGVGIQGYVPSPYSSSSQSVGKFLLQRSYTIRGEGRAPV